MVRCMRYIVLFDVGDGVGTLESGGRLRNSRIVVDATQCLRNRLSIWLEQCIRDYLPLEAGVR